MLEVHNQFLYLEGFKKKRGERLTWKGPEAHSKPSKPL